MTRTVKSAIEFPKLNLSVVETIFSTAGEIIETEHLRPIYPTNLKTFTFKGGKKIEFPGTDQESVTRYAPSEIAPGPLLSGKTHFKTTILEDNTCDYCIQTTSILYYLLESSITNVDTGNTMNISRGCLIYVAGTDYKVNNIICSENELFAVENNDVILVASSSCRVYMFRALPRV